MSVNTQGVIIRLLSALWATNRLRVLCKTKPLLAMSLARDVIEQERAEAEQRANEMERELMHKNEIEELRKQMQDKIEHESH